MIKRLARSLREFTLAAILSPLCMMGEVYMEVKIPGIIATIVDYGIKPGAMEVVWQQGLMLVLCALCSLTFGVASAVFAAYAATGFSRNLRHDMFYKVQTFDFLNIDKFSTASIVTLMCGNSVPVCAVSICWCCPCFALVCLCSSSWCSLFSTGYSKPTISSTMWSRRICTVCVW